MQIAGNEFWLSRNTAVRGHAVLHDLCSRANCADGNMPTVGSLVDDGSGHFFGMTYAGGANGKGTVYEVNPNRSTFNVLYSFCSQPNCADGWGPLAGLAILPGTACWARPPTAGLTLPARFFS